MSGGPDADIALLNGVLEDWERGEFWDGEPYADDVVFVTSGPDGGEYHGIDGLTAAWRGFLTAWEGFRIQTERVVAGDAGSTCS
jgi:hypothetical protein